jgi:hypothetical protein
MILKLLSHRVKKREESCNMHGGIDASREDARVLGEDEKII